MGVSTYKNEARFSNNIYKTDDNSFNFQNVGANFVFHNPSSAWNRFAIGVKYSEENFDNWIKLGRNDNIDRKSTRLNSSHVAISYAVFCLKKKNTKQI